VRNKLNDTHGLAVAVSYAALLSYYERNHAEVARWASDLIELSTRRNFALFLAFGSAYRGWARSVSDGTPEAIAFIQDGIEGYRASGSMLLLPLFLTLKAEASHLLGRIPDALAALREAEALVETLEGRCWRAELYRLRGVILAAMGADETQIEASFCEAIRIATEQKSVSLEKRAEVTYAEYRRQKTNASAGRGLSLW
jgi:hypothetical protein